MYVKSPLNYVGGKHKLLKQIMPLFPQTTNTFIDLFAGGCNVGINAVANKVICNDIQSEVISLMNYLKGISHDEFILEIENIIEMYGLSRSDLHGYEHYGVDSSKGLVTVNKKAFECLRNDYNSGNKEDSMFYAMVVYSFNNAIRFNDKGQYNQSCNKRDFNSNIRKSLQGFKEKAEKINIDFTNLDFREFDFSIVDENSFVYCDPPYFISGVAYNVNNHGWDEHDEKDLYDVLDNLNKRGIKFAFSNVARNKGKENSNLIGWAQKYNVIDLKHSYKNSYFSSKDKSEDSTREVLIINYELS